MRWFNALGKLETKARAPLFCAVVGVSSFSRQDAAERRLKVHGDIPFALDASLCVTFDWGDPYWKMASVASAGPVGADALQTALALARLVKEAGARAWIYEFGIPGLLTHAVCVVEVAGRWWVEDPFFDTTFKTPLTKVLETLEAGDQPARSPEKTERICLVAKANLAGAEALAATAARELSPIGDVRRFSARLDREAYLGLMDESDILSESLEDLGLRPGFDSLMLLPLRGLEDGKSFDLGAGPGGAATWFAARLGDKRRREREAGTQERGLTRLAQRSRERRIGLQAELAAAVVRAEAEGARSADLQAQLQSVAGLETHIVELSAALESGEGRAQALERRAADAEAAQIRAGHETEAGATALRTAQAEAVAAREAVQQLEQRLEQLRAAADDATREAATARELQLAAEETVLALRQDLAAQASGAVERQQRLAATRAALARTRARALAALRQAAGAAREIGHLSEALEATRRGADQALDDLGRRHEDERRQDAERTRDAEAAAETLRSELATLAAGFAEQGARAQARAADLEAGLARLGAELRSAEAANQAQRAAAEASARREIELTATADALRGEVLELAAARQSLSLGLADASRREVELETARRALSSAVGDATEREARLLRDAETLSAQVADLKASGEAQGAALQDNRAQALAAQAADRLKARVLDNVVSRAAAIGDFEATGLDPFDALDRLSARLAEIGAERAALAGRLASLAADRDKRLSVRLGRLLGLVRTPRAGAQDPLPKDLKA